MNNDNTNYDDLELFINMVNQDKPITEVVTAEANRTQPKAKVVQYNPTNKTINPNKSIGNKKKTSHKKIKYIMDKILIGTSLVGLLTTTAFMMTNDIELKPRNNTTDMPTYNDEVEVKNITIERYMEKLKLQKLEELRINNLIDISIKTKLSGETEFRIELKNNLVEDYQRLTINSYVDLYIFKHLLSNEEYVKLQQAHQHIEMQTEDKVRNELFENGHIIIAETQHTSEANYISNEINLDLSSRNDTIKYFNEILQKQKLYELLNNGLAKIESNEKGDYYIKINNNTITDYKKLNLSDHLDIYIYRQILPGEEFDKLIQSATYKNKYNNEYNYTDFMQFLRINGYYDKDNNPSNRVFENYMEEELYQNRDQFFKQLQMNNSEFSGKKH